MSEDVAAAAAAADGTAAVEAEEVEAVEAEEVEPVVEADDDGGDGVGGDSTEEERNSDDNNDDSSDDSSDSAVGVGDGDNDDGDNDGYGSSTDSDAMEVEVTSAGDDESSDNGDDNDNDTEENYSAAASTSPLPPPPEATGRSGPPKMRIKLKLKMPSRPAPPPPPAAAAAPAPAELGGEGGGGGSSNPSTSASDVSKGGDNTPSETNDDTDHDEDEDEATAEAMIVDEGDDATAEAIEEAPVAQQQPAVKVRITSTGSTDMQSISSNATETQEKTTHDNKEMTKQQPSQGASPSPSKNKDKGHPFHKPAAERAPPPSLSRPASLNPQLSYTTTSGQGGGYHSRAVRLPAILSPGLLAIPNAPNSVGMQVCDTEAYKALHNTEEKATENSSREANADAKSRDAGGKMKSSTSVASAANTTSDSSDPYAHYYTASSVFSHHMAASGYTTEARSHNPHLGSSIRRTVGDMFDLDVMSSAHFPKLIPDYMRVPIDEGVKGSNCNGTAKESNIEAQHDQAASTIQATATDAAATAPTASDEAKATDEAAEIAADGGKVTLLSKLKSTLTSTLNKRKREMDSQEESEASKRFCPLPFEKMVPVSLTYPYPQEYMQSRREYAQKVKEREEAIAKDQAAAESAREIMDAYNVERSRWHNRLEAWERARAERKAEDAVAAASIEAENSSPPPEEPNLQPLPAPVPIPPIPASPKPPEWDDEAAEGGADSTRSKVKRPSAETLRHYTTYLRHLDPSTYFSSVPTPTARYAGLATNSIADANFIGPAAPGIAGIGLGLGSGLSSAYVSASGGQGGAGLHSSSYYEGLKRALEEHRSVGSGGNSKRRDSASPKAGAEGGGEAKKKKKKKKKSRFKLPLQREPSPPRPSIVTSSSNLKKLMESGGEEAEEMRMAIIKATIYASRKGKRAGDTFVGSDGRGYKDVQRAFSSFGRIKPCPRCRSNKQGAYHCRVRRKHRDEDFDGGDSASILHPFFAAPMETLIHKYTGSTGSST